MSIELDYNEFRRLEVRMQCNKPYKQLVEITMNLKYNVMNFIKINLTLFRI